MRPELLTYHAATLDVPCDWCGRGGPTLARDVRRGLL